MRLYSFLLSIIFISLIAGCTEKANNNKAPVTASISVGNLIQKLEPKDIVANLTITCDDVTIQYTKNLDENGKVSFTIPSDTYGDCTFELIASKDDLVFVQIIADIKLSEEDTQVVINNTNSEVEYPDDDDDGYSNYHETVTEGGDAKDAEKLPGGVKCKPDRKICTENNKAVITCNSEGSAWGEEVSCKENEECTEGECFNPACNNEEICDGQDNDCDGAVDEDCDCTDNTTRECGIDTGECEKGTQTCENGKWGECNDMIRKAVEICDGKDNDCDGEVDNNLLAPNADLFEGVCTGLTKNCNGEEWVNPDYSDIGNYEEDESSCDGLDNDCDGTVDEGCTEGECAQDEQRDCGETDTDIGECQIGTQTCNEGSWGVCIDEVTPSEEICDGKDNDCDISVDEELQAQPADKTDGVCSGLTKSCNGSNGWVEPDYVAIAANSENSAAMHYYQTVETLCDGYDNDCDGDFDEGCSSNECTDGEMRNCGEMTSDTGACQYGTQTCDNGVWGSCEGEIVPTEEVCDGKDNNCNGAVDDGLHAPTADKNMGVCTGQIKNCDGIHGWVEPDYYSIIGNYETVESNCDGLDNDCNGAVDENCTCENGKTQPCESDIGVCESGTQTCNNGSWGDCENQITGTAEVCNGLDDDCNGYIDDGLTAPPITKNQGVCNGRVQICSGSGGWIDPDYNSIPDYEPVETMCDQLDNDCDGLANNIESPPAAENSVGVCTGQVKICAGSAGWMNPNYTEIDGFESPELSCDNYDNDCDGTTDEGCDCTDGATKECGIDTGECEKGVQTCNNGSWGNCTGHTTSVQEICDGKDNNCDGTADNFSESEKPDASKNSGVCNGQKKICAGSAGWMEPNYLLIEGFESPESSCDLFDNDCDNETDEGCECIDGRSEICGTDTGECKKGTKECSAGKWGNCIGEIAPSTEICDNKDNDCDGLNDYQDGFDVDGDGFLSCQGDCNDSNGGINPGISETCDGIDNDCNDQIDEGCEEVCNGVDDNNNGQVDEGFDNDGDGFTICGGDCDDSEGGINPGISETCDGIDNDCNNQIDEGCPEICGDGQDNNNDGEIDENCPEICGDEQDNNSNGQVDEFCNCDLEDTCGDDIDNDCDGFVDELCEQGLRFIAAGGYHSCAVFTDGIAKCWGWNSDGQLGINNGELGNSVEPLDVAFSEGFIRILAGKHHTCGITGNNKVLCWGRNSSGQVGVGDNEKRFAPANVSLEGNIQYMSLGESHTCSINNMGIINCWGANAYGQIGTGNASGSYIDPTPVESSLTWKFVSSGYTNTCAIEFSTNERYCWGNNGYGRLGNGSSGGTVTNPEKFNNSKWRIITLGEQHGCGIKDNLSLWCWGRNSFKQMGIPDLTNDEVTAPVLVSDDKWSYVDASGYHTCAIKMDGSLWCWGRNNSKQCATSGDTVPEPVKVGVRGWLHVSAGNEHTCGINDENKALCWGDNYQGQIGFGESGGNVNSPTPVNFESGGPMAK